MERFLIHLSAFSPWELPWLSNFMGMSAAIAAPVGSGWLKDLTGSLESSFYLGGAIVLLGTLFLVFVDETVAAKSLHVFLQGPASLTKYLLFRRSS